MLIRIDEYTFHNLKIYDFKLEVINFGEIVNNDYALNRESSNVMKCSFTLEAPKNLSLWDDYSFLYHRKVWEFGNITFYQENIEVIEENNYFIWFNISGLAIVN